MIVLGSDHAGYELKNKLISYLKSQNIETIDVGCFDESSVDYPLIGYKIGKEVIKNNCFGIGVCGSGIGISMALNKVKGIRAVNVNNPDLARLSRQHNNANVICFGQRLINYEDAISYLDIFLNEKFIGEHHTHRVDQLNKGDI